MTVSWPVVLCIYLFAVNLTAVLLTIIDKHNARKRLRRVRESTLLLFGALGGALCEWVTMLIIRHKTQHLKFMFWLPIFFTAHILLLGWLIIRLYA